MDWAQPASGFRQPAVEVRYVGEIFKRTVPEKPLEWTGERLTTAFPGQIEIEHLHRYFLARTRCRGLDVLDVASGEGYGAALLAQTARSVTGVETSAEAVVHAAKAYRNSNLRFVRGDARLLPLHDASVDAVVSFETIEHFDGQDRFLTEVRRVLRPGGCLIVSSPDRDIYSPSGSPANPFHVCELSRIEFSQLLHKFFAHVHLMGQRPMLGSALVSDGPAKALWTFERRGSDHFEATAGLPRSVYVVAVASDELADVPDSIFIETDGIQAMLAPPSTAAEDEARAELESMRAQAAAARTETEAALADLAHRLGEQEAETARLTAELEARLKESAALGSERDRRDSSPPS